MSIPTGHGIADEPQSGGGTAEGDQHRLAAEPQDPGPAEPDAGIWDEPGAGPAPATARSYAHVLADGCARTSTVATWATTLLVALAAGPWAVLTAVVGNSTTGAAMPLVMVVFGPLCEEVAKIAVAMMVLERWPWRFRSGVQLVLAAACGGLVFAAIENLLYLHVLVPDPPEWLAPWRWSVCVALHTGCSLIAGLGLLHIHRRAMAAQRRPDPTHALPYIAAAAIIHGTYNGLALIWELAT